jgi:Flp pilus assembly protein TadG
MNSNRKGIWGRFSPPSPFQKLLSDRKGSAYFELMLKTLVVITLMLTVISFLSVFTTYLNLSHVCRRVVRVVELEGQVSDRANDVFYKLKQQTGLTPEMTVEDVTYVDGQKIQLRDTFTVMMTYNYPFTIFTPSFAPPVEIQIPMKVRIGGMSEHYWK